MLDPKFKKERFRSQNNFTQTSQLLENKISLMRNSPFSTHAPPAHEKQFTPTVIRCSVFTWIEDKLQNKYKWTLADVMIIKRQDLKIIFLIWSVTLLSIFLDLFIAFYT